MEPISLEELANTIGGAFSTPRDRQLAFERVVLSPSAVRQGDLFWDVASPSCPEHVQQAERQGALASVVGETISAGTRRLHVSDPRAAFIRFASWYRSLLDTYLIGVVGQAGTTILSDLLRSALAIPSTPDASGQSDSADSTLDLAASLLSLRNSDRVALATLRARANSPPTSPLAIARPESTVFARAIASPSAEFSDWIDQLPRGGFAILPGDAPLPHHSGKAAVLQVGQQPGNSHRVQTETLSTGRLRFQVDRAPFEITAPGPRWSIAAGMAVIAARRLGQSDRQTAQNLESYEPRPGYGRITTGGIWTLIDESARGDFTELLSALQDLANWPALGRRIAVLGAIDRPAQLDPIQRKTLCRHLVELPIDLLVAIGPFARQIAQEARIRGKDAPCLAEFLDSPSATNWLKPRMESGDVVWIHAARAAGLSSLATALRPPTHQEQVEASPRAA